MDKAQLVFKNGARTVVPIPMENGKPPAKFEHQGRVFELHHRQVGTGKTEIRGVYQELEPKKAGK